jgi:hypothetical protein
VSGHELGERLLVEFLRVVHVAHADVASRHHHRSAAAGRGYQAGDRVRQAGALGHGRHARPPGESCVAVGRAHDTLLVPACHDGQPAAFRQDRRSSLSFPSPIKANTTSVPGRGRNDEGVPRRFKPAVHYPIEAQATDKRPKTSTSGRGPGWTEPAACTARSLVGKVSCRALGRHWRLTLTRTTAMGSRLHAPCPVMHDESEIGAGMLSTGSHAG